MAGSLVKFVKLYFVKYCCTLSNYVVRGYKSVAFCLISKYVYAFTYPIYEYESCELP